MLNWTNSTPRQRRGAEPSPLLHFAFYGLRRSFASRTLLRDGTTSTRLRRAALPLPRSHKACTHPVSSVPSVVRAFHSRTTWLARSPASRDEREAWLLRQGSAFGPWADAHGIMSTSSAKLDFPPNPTKSTTSKFLIDNFCMLLRSPASKSTSVGSCGALHSPLACPERSRRLSSAAAFPEGRFPALPRAGYGLSSGSAAELERGIEAPPGSGHLAASSAGKLFMTSGHPIFDRLEAAEVYNCVSSPRGRYETSV